MSVKEDDLLLYAVKCQASKENRSSNCHCTRVIEGTVSKELHKDGTWEERHEKCMDTASAEGWGFAKFEAILIPICPACLESFPEPENDEEEYKKSDFEDTSNYPFLTDPELNVSERGDIMWVYSIDCSYFMMKHMLKMRDDPDYESIDMEHQSLQCINVLCAHIRGSYRQVFDLMDKAGS